MRMQIAISLWRSHRIIKDKEAIECKLSASTNCEWQRIQYS
jgi:hypothetical protein